ncbi:MmoB/DmpM family protein [Nocardioides pyridinolyticus]
MASVSDGTEEPKKMVGPILRGVDTEFCNAMINAIETDNPGTEVVVDDQGGYIRISTERRCRLTRTTLEDELGHPFRLSGIEPNLAGFSGRINVGDDEIIWHLDREG